MTKDKLPTVDIKGKNIIIQSKVLMRIYEYYYLDREGNCYSTLVPGTRGKRTAHILRRLTGSVNKAGYIVVSLGKANPKYLHHLMLEAFVGPRPKGMDGCHRNDVPSDNRIENLYWGTRKQNVEDSRRNGGLARTAEAHRGVSPANKWTPRQIAIVVDLRKGGYSLKQIAEELCVSYPSVQKYCAEHGLSKIGLNRWNTIPREGVKVA